MPDGVELRDASEVLPEDAIFRDPRGGVAFFSDWFRLVLQQRGLGTWIDTDVYLLRPLDLDRPYLFGEQEPGVLNTAVLRLPRDSVVLDDLLRPFERQMTPYWLPWRAWLRSRLTELLRGKADLARLPWGSTGPHALTAVARRHGMLGQALPSEVFYPVPWQKAEWVRDPALGLDDVVTERTVAVHLWNERIKGFKDAPAADGSFLRRLQREGAD